MKEMKFNIDNENPYKWLWYDDIWKKYCGAEDFDETFVLKGNRNYREHTEASWYKKAYKILADIEQGVGRERYPELDDEAWKDLEKIVDAYNIDTIFTVYRAAEVLFPDIGFKTATIWGYSMEEWQEVLYRTDKTDGVDLLEASYFGKYSEISDEEGCFALVTHDELWEAKREGKVKELVRQLFGLSEDTVIRVYESDGYRQVQKWKEIA